MSEIGGKTNFVAMRQYTLSVNAGRISVQTQSSATLPPTPVLAKNVKTKISQQISQHFNMSTEGNNPMDDSNQPPSRLNDDSDEDDEMEDDITADARAAAAKAVLAAAALDKEEAHEPEMRISSSDLEIVGLLSSTSGRSCSSHVCCGKEVKKGDVLRLVKTVVTVSNRPEDAIKLVKIIDGADCCTVAFVPRVWTPLPRVQRNINKFVMVQEMYHESTNVSKRDKSIKNLGVAGCVFLDEIPHDE